MAPIPPEIAQSLLQDEANFISWLSTVVPPAVLMVGCLVTIAVVSLCRSCTGERATSARRARLGAQR